jgi:acylglycerol lipase
VSELTGSIEGVAGLTLHWRRWVATAPRARVVLVHGYGEHSGRYQHVAARLVGAGYEVIALDHRGMGRSEGKRAALRSFDHYIADLHAFIEHATHEWGALPVVMLGHSMGGLVASVYALEHEADLVALILSAPAVMPPSDVSGATIAVAKLIAKVAPDMRTVKLPLHLVSRDPAVVEAYNGDPLVERGKVRARAGAEMLRAIDRVGAGYALLSLPVLLMQGSADGIIDPGAARFVSERIGSRDVTLKEYPGLYHEIFNEPEQDQVLGDVVEWLDAHVGQAAAESQTA